MPGLRGDIYRDRTPLLAAVNASDGSISWSTEIEGEILGSPVISGRWLIFGTDRQTYSMSLKDFFEDWKPFG